LLAEDNANLTSVSGFGDDEMNEFALIYNRNLTDISNINPNLITNELRIVNNSVLDICNYDFVCNHQRVAGLLLYSAMVTSASPWHT